MADRNLTYRITAKDDASAVTSKIAKAAKKDFGAVEKAMDDTRSAGKKMADALETVAEDLDTELEKTEDAVDELARALGPEFVAKVGRGGVETVVTELRQAGLTFEDIEQDADELALAIRKVEDVAGRAAKQTSGAFRQVSTDARTTGGDMDRTGSVFANFTGNAVQDLPGISGSFGAVNVAAGQFVEYATAGGIALKKMAATLGPIAAITAVISLMSQHFGDIAKAKAFNREQAEDWANAINDGATAAEAMRDSFVEAGEVEFQFAEGGGDLSKSLSDLNIGVTEFTQLSEMSEYQIRNWGEAQRDAGADAQAVTLVTLAAIQAHDNLAGAEERAAINARLGIGPQKELGEKTKDTADATEDAVTQTDLYTEAQDRNREATERRTTAMNDLLDATLAQFDAGIAHRQAERDTAQAYSELNAVIADSDSTMTDVAAASDEAAQAALNQAEAAADLAIETYGLEGAANEATVRQQTMRAELQNIADSLAPTSPLRAQLQAYIDSLNELDGRQVEVDILANYGLSGSGVPLTRTTGARQHGGPVFPGRAYMVGEAGPEMIVPKAAATVTPNRAGGLTQTVHIDVHGDMTRETADDMIAKLGWMLTTRGDG